jgi:hypothetical protein
MVLIRRGLPKDRTNYQPVHLSACWRTASFSLLSWRLIASTTGIFGKSTKTSRECSMTHSNSRMAPVFSWRSGSNGASTSGAAKRASRGSDPEAHQLRGLTLAGYPEKSRESAGR